MHCKKTVLQDDVSDSMYDHWALAILRLKGETK